MNIKILYDNTSKNDGFACGWGFSCLVGDSVLFDTGEKAGSLLKNMKTMKVNISDIKHIVISHDHWDHAGGLEGVLKKNKNVTIYGGKSFSSEFKELSKKNNIKPVENKYFSNISGNIYTTGTFSGEYKGNKIEEQSLVIRTHNGLTLITGCAHPGIIKITEHVKKLFSQDKIYCVLGGFHLKDACDKEIIFVCESLKSLGVEKAGPAHCSGSNGIKIFKGIYKENFVEISSGTEIEV
ncbi:MAG: MBL fold metallo-hydrolase [Candidatus Omnitrophica bacterium]|nr:MBL fold metallo-hydrolase [Candidatus Omnitrophota bacterium]